MSEKRIASSVSIPSDPPAGDEETRPAHASQQWIRRAIGGAQIRNSTWATSGTVQSTTDPVIGQLQVTAVIAALVRFLAQVHDRAQSSDFGFEVFDTGLGPAIESRAGQKEVGRLAVLWL